MVVNYSKAPFPWFGGKADAAPIIWRALGDIAHYAEPFAGSLAVLLRRPHPANRPYYSETVNDLDGLLVNAWRSIQLSPQATADAASWPVSEADLHARHIALVKWRTENNLERLMADPKWHDPVMGGWWMWGQSSWIGSGWCSGDGPWTVGEDGRIYRQPRVKKGDAREPGVRRQLPHLGDNGKGVNHAGTREPGVSRQLPHLGDDGKGVNHAGTREPGVSRQLPHLGNDGRGVNRPQLREHGVSDESGIITEVSEFHPMTMPELLKWMEFLSARLRHVRILNGDWARACTGGATKTLPVRGGKGKHCGIFLDPPYADTAERTAQLYAKDSLSVAHAVRDWCIKRGTDTDTRIVLAGFSGEHDILAIEHGWTEVEWYSGGFLRGGMGNTAKAGTHSQYKERLWLSPHCLGVTAEMPSQQRGLWT